MIFKQNYQINIKNGEFREKCIHILKNSELQNIKLFPLQKRNTIWLNLDVKLNETIKS